ncbi:MAG TPA: lysylphosphatidylglycerol synthase transmembrane domain-containing protein [Candidatus Paceibacterota bacterium]
MKYARLTAKIVVTAGLLFFLFWSIDVGQLWEHIRTIPLYALLIIALAWWVATILNTVRWAVLLRIQGLAISLFRLLKYNLAFTFYTVALPGGKVSAEAVRIYQIVRDTEQGMRERAALSAIADRTVAALTFVALSLASAPLLLETLPSLPSWFLYALAVSIVVVAVSVFVPFESLLFWFSHFLPEVLRGPLSQIGSSFALFRHYPMKLCMAFAFSIVSALAMAGGVHVVVMSLGIGASFGVTLAAFSVGTLAAMIPLTVAGIGIREGAFTYLFAALSGASLEVGLSVSLVALAASFLVAFVGGSVECHRLFAHSRLV